VLARAARQLAERLDLDVLTAGVCLPCLTFVAFPLDLGRDVEARGAARRITPDLWAEGLEDVVVAALGRAQSEGVRGASEAAHDVWCRGADSPVVAAIVWRLAEDLVEDMRGRRARGHLLPERRRDCGARVGN
jgi:hypothetical protein